ncbi:hypothetical protein MDAP_001523 [Mitosporidium daphniae]
MKFNTIAILLAVFYLSQVLEGKAQKKRKIKSPTQETPISSGFAADPISLSFNSDLKKLQDELNASSSINGKYETPIFDSPKYDISPAVKVSFVETQNPVSRSKAVRNLETQSDIIGDPISKYGGSYNTDARPKITNNSIAPLKALPNPSALTELSSSLKKSPANDSIALQSFEFAPLVDLERNKSNVKDKTDDIPKIFNDGFFLNKNLNTAKVPWYTESFKTLFAALNELQTTHFIFLLPLLIEKYTLILLTFINDFLLEYSLSNQFTACTLFLIYIISFVSVVECCCSAKDTSSTPDDEVKKREKKKKNAEISSSSSSSSSSDSQDSSSWFTFGNSADDKNSKKSRDKKKATKDSSE